MVWIAPVRKSLLIAILFIWGSAELSKIVSRGERRLGRTTGDNVSEPLNRRVEVSFQ